MSIYNQNPDPDYPVLNGPGFIQHTCQPYAQVQQQYYYNGQYAQPIQQPMDSRRYAAPAQPTFATPTPAQPQPTFGFNQLAEESRRNMSPIQPQQAQASPWSVPTAAQQVQQQYLAPTPAIPQPTYDPRYAALYQYNPTFDKKSGVWNNSDVCNPYVAPAVNWGAAEIPVPAQPQQFQYQQPVFSPAQPQMQQDWEMIAKTNFGPLKW